MSNKRRPSGSGFYTNVDVWKEDYDVILKESSIGLVG